jgi:1-acyl-sn-glycerol-3-phosphate acyltransferase
VPPFGGYIVAANHASHLDMGLCKHALGEQGDAGPGRAGGQGLLLRRSGAPAYFENFTNLVPMERFGSLRESLRLAGDVLRQGYVLLIFPEGTRSETGVMADFKPSLGYLAMTNKCGILPMYLSGTHDAMPKGRLLPKARRRGRGSHRAVPVVRRRGGDGRRPDPRRGLPRDQPTRSSASSARWRPADHAWTLGEPGTHAVGDWASARPGRRRRRPGAR